MLLVELEESSDSDVDVVVVVMDVEVLSLEPDELDDVEEPRIRVTSLRKLVFKNEEVCEDELPSKV